MRQKYLQMGAMTFWLSGSGEDNGGNITDITALQVTPANSRIPVGFERQLTVLAHMSDGSVFDVTDDHNVSWSSSDASIATVDSTGLVTGVNAGIIIMVASGTNVSGQHIEATAQVDVTNGRMTGLQVTLPQPLFPPASRKSLWSP